MKIGIISDIHSNIFALDSVIESGISNGVQKWYCLGDISGYYYWPSECINLLRELSVKCIAGNHDKYLCDKYKTRNDLKERTGGDIRIALDTLSDDQFSWLCTLPNKLKISVDGHKVLLCHGSPWDLNYYLYPDATYEVRSRIERTDVDIVFFGHTHYPIIWDDLNVLSVNPGSVGQPRDRSPGACWAIWDTRENNISLKREIYDLKNIIQACKKYDPNDKYLQDVLTRE
jgi:putative phosphoesterase